MTFISRPLARRAIQAASSAADRALIEPLGASAFPLDGDPDAFVVPEGSRFYERDEAGRLFHEAPRGGKLPEATYRDDRSLLFVPKGFRASQPAALVLFLHGNMATLARDVARRQRVPAQVEDSRANVLLVAPQLADNALDSSAGNFWNRDFFDRYLDAAADKLATMPGVKLRSDEIKRLPIILVAYSGGYLPAAFSLKYALDRGASRIAGVIMLDALFGEEIKFASWLDAEHARTFFVSVYSKASADLNAVLQRDIAPLHAERSLPASIGPGTIVFQLAPNATHNDFVTMAVGRDPLVGLLTRIDLSRLGMSAGGSARE